MLLGVAGVQDLSTLDLLDNRFCSIYEIYTAAVLAGLDELTRVLVGYYVHIGSLVPYIVMNTVD